MFERLAERLEHAVELRSDGFANGLAEDGEQRVGQHARIGLHGKLERFFEQRLQGAAEFDIRMRTGVLTGTKPDGFSQYSGDVFSAARWIVQALAHAFPSRAIRTKKDGAQLGKRLICTVVGHGFR